jgi:hypothetical protein
MCKKDGAQSHCSFKGIPIYIVSVSVYTTYTLRAHCHILPRALPRTAAHWHTVTHALPHCRTAAHLCTLPHCRTLMHTSALPHTAALSYTAALPDSGTLPCALPYTTKRTATHCRAHSAYAQCHAHYRAHCYALSLTPLALLHCRALPHILF